MRSRETGEVARLDLVPRHVRRTTRAPRSAARSTRSAVWGTRGQPGDASCCCSATRSTTLRHGPGAAQDRRAQRRVRSRRSPVSARRTRACCARYQRRGGRHGARHRAVLDHRRGLAGGARRAARAARRQGPDASTRTTQPSAPRAPHLPGRAGQQREDDDEGAGPAAPTRCSSTSRTRSRRAAKESARADVVAALVDGDWSGRTRTVRVNATDDAVDARRRARRRRGRRRATSTRSCCRRCRPPPRCSGSTSRSPSSSSTPRPAASAASASTCRSRTRAACSPSNEIAAASPRVEALHFGPGDFQASLGMRTLAVGALHPDYPGDQLHHVFMTLLVAARAARRPGARRSVHRDPRPRRPARVGRAGSRRSASTASGCCTRPRSTSSTRCSRPTQEEFDRAVGAARRLRARDLEAAAHAAPCCTTAR